MYASGENLPPPPSPFAPAKGDGPTNQRRGRVTGVGRAGTLGGLARRPGRPTPHESKSTHAIAFRPHAVHQRHAAVRGAADVRQDGVAAAGRDARRVEHLHGLLPGDAAGRVRVRPPVDQVARSAAPGGRSLGFVLPAVAGAADRGGGRLDPAGRVQPHPVAAVAAGGFGGSAVSVRLGQRADVAGMVRRDGPPQRQGPLLPLRGQQPGQHAGASGLSAGAGAVSDAARAGMGLDGRLRSDDGDDAVVRGLPVAPARDLRGRRRGFADGRVGPGGRAT